MEENLPFCRICLDIDELPNLISPCLCSGTSKWVHKKCLNRWRALVPSGHENNKICKECRGEYNYDYTRTVRMRPWCNSTRVVVFTTMILNIITIGYSAVCTTSYDDMEDDIFSQCAIDLLPVLMMSTVILFGVVCRVTSNLYEKISASVLTVVLTFTLTAFSLFADPSSTSLSLIVVGQGYVSVAKWKDFQDQQPEEPEWVELE